MLSVAALPGAQAAVGVVQKGLRPVIPSSCPAGLASVMRDCWQRDPRERPSFEQLKVRASAPACLFLCRMLLALLKAALCTCYACPSDKLLHKNE